MEAGAGAWTDRDIQSAILRRLDRDLGVRAADVGVLVRDGVVTLCGITDTIADRRSAERAAGDVPGVAEVRVELLVYVTPSAHLRDVLRPVVAQALRREPTLPTATMRVEVTSDGAVVLTGSVRSAAQRALAEQVLERLASVREVRNRLTIERPVGSRPAPHPVVRLPIAEPANDLPAARRGATLSIGEIGEIGEIGGEARAAR